MPPRKEPYFEHSFKLECPYANLMRSLMNQKHYEMIQKGYEVTSLFMRLLDYGIAQ